MKLDLLRRLSRRERRVEQRINKANWSGQSPMIAPPTIQYELADRVQAMNAGGLGVVQQLVKQLGLAESINRHCPIFKLRLPYSEADHVLNIAFNLLAGGTCLEHLELRRKDEAYLNALGAERIPDPTTAGDFCRRFGTWDVVALQESFHEARLKVWQQQPDSFFDLAVIEADGTQVETGGEHKEGMSMNYKGEWGYHPLVVTLANTREVLYLWNRPGNRPSHERAFMFFDRSIDLCRRAGFREVRLRGDTDFSQSRHLDRWHNDNVQFVFGFDAIPKLVELAESLGESAWKELHRKQRTATKRRARRPNFKEQVVVAKEYTNKRLEKEFVAEFDYSPGLCQHTYRMVVLKKQVAVMKGVRKLFDDSPYFFYITNIRSPEKTAADVVVATVEEFREFWQRHGKRGPFLEEGIDQWSSVAVVERLETSEQPRVAPLVLGRRWKNDDASANRALRGFVSKDEAVASHRHEWLLERDLPVGTVARSNRLGVWC